MAIDEKYMVRVARKQDSADLARLLTNLGHPIETDSILERWDEWIGSDHEALIAENEAKAVVGMVAIHQMMVLHRTFYTGRITALIVDEKFRNQGIGRALVAAAESRLSEWGCHWLEVTSNQRFAQSHTFYQHLGYSQTSVRFRKSLT